MELTFGDCSYVCKSRQGNANCPKAIMKSRFPRIDYSGKSETIPR